MRHLTARELIKDGKPSGKFHFCTGTYPIGYCSPNLTCPKCNGWYFYGSKTVKCDCKDGLIPNPNQCIGHNSADEACRCYHKYLLDRARRYKSENSMEKCEICKQFTQDVLMYGSTGCYYICEGHTREEIENVIDYATEIWES